MYSTSKEWRENNLFIIVGWVETIVETQHQLFVGFPCRSTQPTIELLPRLRLEVYLIFFKF